MRIHQRDSGRNRISFGLFRSWSWQKGSPYSITERRVPELIPVLGSQPAGDVSHKPGDRLLLLSARPAVIHATLKRAAKGEGTPFSAWFPATWAPSHEGRAHTSEYSMP